VEALDTGKTPASLEKALRPSANCVLSLTMAGSMKDALRKSGLAPAAPPKQQSSTHAPKNFREELSDDESLPPRFDAPALTKAPPPRK
jgi:hypothetical protein